MVVNLREVAMRTLRMKEDKERLDFLKDQMRNGAKITGKTYAGYSFSDQVNNKWSPEDQLKVDQFCAREGIEKIETRKKDYKVTIVPTPKAIAEYNKTKAPLMKNKAASGTRK